MNNSQLVTLLSKNKLLIEIVLVVFVAVSVWLNYSAVSGGAEALMISMTTLAGFYFVAAFFMVEITGIFTVVALKVFSIASSVCVIGLLFTILKLTGAANMLMIGASAMGISGLLILYSAATAWKSDYLLLLLRVVVLGGIAVSTLMEVM
jgi:hypothetical protein